MAEVHCNRCGSVSFVKSGCVRGHQRYLASFAWRFNRRYQLDSKTERLIWTGLQAKPQPHRVIVAG